jgi:hypothetical protein
METQDKPTKLTNLQLELLKIFSRDLPDEELLEIKNILSAYFAEKATKEMDRLWDEKGWTQETMQQWLNEHMRTPYNYAG